MKQKNIMQRYLKELLLSMIAYTVILITSLTVLKNYEFSKLWQIAISFAPALPVAFVILAIMRLLKDVDELQQKIQLSSISLAAALTAFLTFSYGFLENAGLPKLPTFLILPMLFLFWGVGTAYFSRKYQ